MFGFRWSFLNSSESISTLANELTPYKITSPATKKGAIGLATGVGNFFMPKNVMSAAGYGREESNI